MIGIANTMDFPERLLHKIASRIGRLLILILLQYFKKYKIKYKGNRRVVYRPYTSN